MEKDSEIQLPEAIIQHIQSFLNRKQAAQTSILSKSWYCAWSTRPSLDFHENDFCPSLDFHEDDFRKTDAVSFTEFVEKTMQRYKESNLRIDSFRLWTRNYERAEELIVEAIKMGAIDLELESLSESRKLVLPHEVLASKTLINLSLCRIDLGSDGRVNCSRLKSLSLRYVSFEGYLIRNIISCCPLIEKLLFSKCKCLFKDKSCNVIMTSEVSPLSPTIVFDKLTHLALDLVDVSTLFSGDFSSWCPCLKELTLRSCRRNQRLEVSSRSLECISFEVCEKWWQTTKYSLLFNVPSIRKFKFSSSRLLPRLTFKTAQREWESGIYCLSCDDLTTEWFLRLKDFLREFNQSKITLSMEIGKFSESRFDHTRDVQGLPRPVVENLHLYTYYYTSTIGSAHMDGLFWSCRPKLITLSSMMAEPDLVELLCNTLMSENCCIPNRNRRGLRDLEEVSAEVFDRSLAKWLPLPLNALLDVSAGSREIRPIRFKLRWDLESVGLN